MDKQIAGEYQDVVEAVKAFNKGLHEDERMADLLSYFRAWYYIPELKFVGPSKFIGYKGMTAEEYWSRNDLDGRETEPRLSKWFRLMDEETPEAKYVEDLVVQLLAQYNKTPNRKARFNAPVAFSINESGQQEPARIPAHFQAGGSQPIVEVYWRAFLTLYPEDQDALAKRILEYRR